MPSQSRTASERVRDALWGDRAARTRTLIAIGFLVACVAYLIAVHALGIETEVMRDRFWKNAEPLFNGVVPATEYPPLALVFIAIPRLFGSDPWGYEVAYVAMMYVFMVAGLCLVSRMAASLRRDRGRAMIAYAVLVLLMLEFVLDRFDLIAMVLTLAAFVLFAERRTVPAFVLLAMGVLTKVYPAVFFPVMVLALAYDRRYADAVKGLAAFVLTGAVAVAVCVLIDPGIITTFIDYNGDRPLQIESVAASLIYPFSMLGLTDVWIQGSSADSFWSDNLRGAFPDALSEHLLAVTIVAVVAVWAAYTVLRHRSGGDHGMALMSVTMLATLLVFLVMNKVFSSQYLIWLIAPLVMAMMTSPAGSQDGTFKAVVLAMVLVQVDFAYNVGYLGGGANIDDLGMLIILAKNAVVIYATYLAVRSMASVGRGLAGRRASAPQPGCRGPVRPTLK